MRLAPRLVEHFNWLTHHWPSRQAFQIIPKYAFHNPRNQHSAQSSFAETLSGLLSLWPSLSNAAQRRSLDG
jgi:hypothetical protein